jgi:hypothetical protein
MSAEPLSEGLCPECTTPKCCSSGAGCDRPSAGAKAALASEFRSIIAGWLTAHTNASGAPDKLSVQLANHAFRLIAASRPTDRGEPVADDLLRRAQELAERAPLGHWSNTEDGETLWLMAEALRDRSPATTPYAQDLSEPRPAMATGHDLKDHPKWDAMSGDDRKRAVVKWLESDNPVAQMLRALRKWIDEDDQMSAGVTHQALSLAVAAIYVGAPNHGIPAPSSRLPEGWVAVPKEPTPAMVAAADELDAELRSQGFNGADVRVVYAAMLASTPSPEGA